MIVLQNFKVFMISINWDRDRFVVMARSEPIIVLSNIELKILVIQKPEYFEFLNECSFRLFSWDLKTSLQVHLYENAVHLKLE